MRSPVWIFWVYLCCFLPWLGCLLAYGLRSPWFRSVTGRALFILYASLTAVLGLAWFVRLIDLPHSVLVALALIVLGGVCVAGVLQLVNILRLQKESRRDRTDA